ncbi:hypothetical protein Zmor_021590 [Zophobas morio]|uniref:Uncharacterized protein n=1 Tax=Zophobas morio TaxID=2755281 RepID=A0AA38I911_9CUCU|nr:hypothetical protein Zmor_021590 [Zophobas morio]
MENVYPCSQWTNVILMLMNVLFFIKTTDHCGIISVLWRNHHAYYRNGVLNEDGDGVYSVEASKNEYLVKCSVVIDEESLKTLYGELWPDLTTLVAFLSENRRGDLNRSKYEFCNINFSAPCSHQSLHDETQSFSRLMDNRCKQTSILRVSYGPASFWIHAKPQEKRSEDTQESFLSPPQPHK